MTEPRYQRLTRTLIDAIREERYPVGCLLPPETALAEAHGVSRATVRKAMRQLQERGLVSRRPGYGTRVERPHPTTHYRQRLASIEDLVQFGETHRREVIDSGPIVIDIKTAEELECAPGSHWFGIHTIRVDTEQRAAAPICWTDNFVDPAHTDILEHVTAHPETLISTLIERHYQRRTLRVQQYVAATDMPASIAGRLAVPAGTPALQAVRRYSDDAGDVFLLTRTVHSDNRYRLRSTLTHES